MRASLPFSFRSDTPLRRWRGFPSSLARLRRLEGGRQSRTSGALDGTSLLGDASGGAHKRCIATRRVIRIA